MRKVRRATLGPASHLERFPHLKYRPDGGGRWIERGSPCELPRSLTIGTVRDRSQCPSDMERCFRG